MCRRRGPNVRTGLLAVGFLLCACGSEEAPPAPSPPQAAASVPAPVASVPAPSPAATPVAVPATATQPATVAAAAADKPKPTGRVIVDLSLSMAGFARGSSASLETVHRSILRALSGASVQDVDYCEVTDDDRATCGLEPDPTRYRVRRTYKAAQSLLAASLAAVPEDAPPLPDGLRPVSPVDERTVSIIVTDGLEARHAARRKKKGAAPATGPCLPGQDTFCLQRILAARAAEGYGVWLIGLSLPFDGRVYAERGLDKTFFHRTEEHLQQLRLQPGWTEIPVQVKGLKRNRKTGTDNFRYVGARPLLILLMSRDVSAGRAVLRRLWGELEREKVALPTERMSWVELAPYDSAAFEFSSVVRVGGDKAADAVVPVGGARRAEDGALRAVFECRPGGVADIELRVVMDHDVYPNPAPGQLRGGLDVRMSTSGLPSKAVTAVQRHPSPERAGVYLTSVDCLHFPAGESTLEFELNYELRYEPGQTSGWWHKWSAHNTYEEPEKAYRIADLVEGLLHSCARKAVVQDRARILVRK